MVPCSLSGGHIHFVLLWIRDISTNFLVMFCVGLMWNGPIIIFVENEAFNRLFFKTVPIKLNFFCFYRLGDYMFVVEMPFVFVVKEMLYSRVLSWVRRFWFFKHTLRQFNSRNCLDRICIRFCWFYDKIFWLKFKFWYKIFRLKHLGLLTNRLGLFDLLYQFLILPGLSRLLILPRNIQLDWIQI